MNNELAQEWRQASPAPKATTAPSRVKRKPPLLAPTFEQTINELIEELRQLITQLSKSGDKKPTKRHSIAQTDLPRKIRSSD